MFSDIQMPVGKTGIILYIVLYGHYISTVKYTYFTVEALEVGQAVADVSSNKVFTCCIVHTGRGDAGIPVYTE